MKSKHTDGEKEEEEKVKRNLKKKRNETFLRQLLTINAHVEEKTHFLKQNWGFVKNID